MDLINTILPVATKDPPTYLSPVHALRFFIAMRASSALLQLVNQWLKFTYYSRSHACRYGRNNTNPALVRIELTTSALAGYLLDHSGGEGLKNEYVWYKVGRNLVGNRNPSCVRNLRVQVSGESDDY